MEFITDDPNKLIEDQNQHIVDQNSRYEQSKLISNDMFVELVVSGLAAEQRASFQARSEAIKSVDYETIFTEWEEVSVEKTDLVAEIEATEQSVRMVDTDAQLSRKLVPEAIPEIDALAADRLSALEQDLLSIRQALLESTQKELGYQALCEPWIIPAVPGVIATIRELIIDQPPAVEELSETTVNQNTTVIEVVDKPSVNAEADPTNLEAIGWAIFDHLSQDGVEPMRLEELRANVPELAALSDAEYVLFRHSFTEIREHIINRMTESGVRSAWRAVGNTRGRRYSVHYTAEPERLFRNTLLTRRTSHETEDGQQVVSANLVATSTDIIKPTVDDDLQEQIKPDAIDEPLDTTLPIDVEVIPAETTPDKQSAEVSDEILINNPTEATEAAEAAKELLVVRYGKSINGNARSGNFKIVDGVLDDLARNLPIKKDPQFLRELLL